MSNEKDKSKGSDFEWMLELMKKEHEKFLERPNRSTSRETSYASSSATER